MNTLKRWDGTDLGPAMVPLGVPCEWPDCKSEAVRHACNAEGDPNRSHWHGGIHALNTSGRGGLRIFCETHGLQVLAENERIMKARIK